MWASRGSGRLCSAKLLPAQREPYIVTNEFHNGKKTPTYPMGDPTDGQGEVWHPGPSSY